MENNSRGNTRRKVILYILLFAAAYILQASVLPFINILRVSPELIFTAVICFAMFEKEIPATFVGLGMGLLYDSQSGKLSFNAILFMFTAYLVTIMMKRALNRNAVTAFLLCLGGVLLQNVLTYLFFFASNGWLLTAVTRVILPKLVLTAACVYPIFAAVRRIHKSNTGAEYRVYLND